MKEIKNFKDKLMKNKVVVAGLFVLTAIGSILLLSERPNMRVILSSGGATLCQGTERIGLCATPMPMPTPDYRNIHPFANP